MKKNTFMTVLKLADELGNGIRVMISMPDLPALEVIENPPGNVKHKIKYYENAYDEEMRLKTFNEIKIVDVTTFSRMENLNE